MFHVQCTSSSFLALFLWARIVVSSFPCSMHFFPRSFPHTFINEIHQSALSAPFSCAIISNFFFVVCLPPPPNHRCASGTKIAKSNANNSTKSIRQDQFISLRSKSCSRCACTHTHTHIHHTVFCAVKISQSIVNSRTARRAHTAASGLPVLGGKWKWKNFLN